VAKGYHKDVTDELKRCGFIYSGNAKGSHEIWRSEETGRRVLVPYNLKSKFTANGILKDAGSAKRF
jgi:predicted RNA binding protein YcfA (HicA-like mRNA interferase family)